MTEVINIFTKKRLQPEKVEETDTKDVPEDKEVSGNSSSEDSMKPFMTEILKGLDKLEDKGPKDSMKSFVSELLNGLDGDGKKLFTNMMAIESLRSSPSTDATQDKLVADYTRDQLLNRIINSNSLAWNKNAAFFKAVVRRYKALNRSVIE
jgi:hypothetical protein